MKIHESAENYLEAILMIKNRKGSVRSIAVSYTHLDVYKRQVLKRLSGIQCGFRKTSCSDQLTKAIEEAVAERS